MSGSCYADLNYKEIYKKSEKCHKIDPCGSKIDYNGIIRTVFDLKITFPTCVCVKNSTFDQFLKIFIITSSKFQTKKNVKQMFFPRSPNKCFEPVTKNKKTQKIKADKNNIIT